MSLGRGLGSLIGPKANTIVTKAEEKVEKEIEEKGQSLQIPTDKIEVNPFQPRTDFGHKELEDLVESIKVYGIIQPLIVTKKSDGNYELIAGERRLRSAKILGLKKVPAIVRDAKEQEKLEIALIENVQRQNLNPIEEAVSYKKLIEEFNLTQDEVGKRLGKSRPAVANSVRLLSLPEEIQKGLIDRKISEGHAKAILRLDNEKDQLNFYQNILLHNYNVREAEKQGGKKIKVKSHTRTIEKNPIIEDYLHKLREALGTKVEIDEKKGKGKITVHFFSKEELGEIVRRITN